MKEIDQEEIRLERENIELGMKPKVSAALEGVALHVPTLCRFVTKEFGSWPETLRECAVFAIKLEAALFRKGAKFYINLPDYERVEALLRVTIWQAWENKYRNNGIHDADCRTVVAGVKDQRALRDALNNTAGNIINHLAKGDYKLDDVSVDKVWKVFAEFSSQLNNAYLLEPLRRMGLLEAPREEADDERDAA